MERMDRFEEILSLPALEASYYCSGLARDFLAVTHLRRLLLRLSGGDLVPVRLTRGDGVVELTPVVSPRLNPQTRRLTDPVFEDGLLVNFNTNGVPLRHLINPLGTSTDGSAIGWAFKIPTLVARLGILFIDCKSASALPDSVDLLSPRPISMPRESAGSVKTASGTTFLDATANSVWGFDTDRFLGEMAPRQPPPRVSRADPIRPRELGPDPDDIRMCAVNTGRPGQFRLKFELSEVPEARYGLASPGLGFGAQGTADRHGDSIIDSLLADPLAPSFRVALQSHLEYGEKGGGERLAIQTAVCVLMARRVDAEDPTQLHSLPVADLVDTIASVCIALDGEQLERALSQLTPPGRDEM